MLAMMRATRATATDTSTAMMTTLLLPLLPPVLLSRLPVLCRLLPVACAQHSLQHRASTRLDICSRVSLDSGSWTLKVPLTVCTPPYTAVCEHKGA